MFCGKNFSTLPLSVFYEGKSLPTKCLSSFFYECWKIIDWEFVTCYKFSVAGRQYLDGWTSAGMFN